MTIVVTFEGYRPPDRFDAEPWTEALIYESATVDGTYTLLDTISLTPVDADPTSPAARDFTTALGTAADYWYQIVFVDGNGAVSIATTPVQNSTSAVTPYATVDELSRILKIRNVTAEQTVAMERVLAAAAGEIDAEVGRDTDEPLAGWELSLAADVNLDRAQEHWQQEQVPFGILPIGEFGARISSDTWKRHAEKLAPLKGSWGLA